MAQRSPRFCPQCGAPTQAGQRSCAYCGFTLPASAEEVKNIAQVRTQSLPPPYQPPARTPLPSVSAEIEPEEAPFLPSGRRKIGKGGLIVLLLVILLLLGAAGYIGFEMSGIHLPGIGIGSSHTQPPITTTPLNTSLIYAGVQMTLLKVQQAESFVDDPQTTTTGMVRLTLQEQNKTASPVSWNYYTVAHLVLPDKKVVAPVFVQAKGSIAAGVTQQSEIDFAVPMSTHINQLILRVGASSEAQMDIPLTTHPNLSKYAARTVKLNGTASYIGLNWTLTSATTQLSIAGQQASKNMLFLVLTLSIDNTLSQQAISGSAYDYARLRIGNTTFLPKDTTLPVAFATGEMGQTGTVTFLIPQGSTTCTLVFLPQGGADGASIDFQLA